MRERRRGREIGGGDSAGDASHLPTYYVLHKVEANDEAHLMRGDRDKEEEEEEWRNRG